MYWSRSLLRHTRISSLCIDGSFLDGYTKAELENHEVTTVIAKEPAASNKMFFIDVGSTLKIISYVKERKSSFFFTRKNPPKDRSTKYKNVLLQLL